MDEPSTSRYDERWAGEAGDRPAKRDGLDDDVELAMDILGSGFGQVAASTVWLFLVCVVYTATGYPSKREEEVTWVYGPIAAFGVVGYLVQRASKRL